MFLLSKESIKKNKHNSQKISDNEKFGFVNLASNDIQEVPFSISFIRATYHESLGNTSSDLFRNRSIMVTETVCILSYSLKSLPSANGMSKVLPQSNA